MRKFLCTNCRGVLQWHAKGTPREMNGSLPEVIGGENPKRTVVEIDKEFFKKKNSDGLPEKILQKAEE